VIGPLFLDELKEELERAGTSKRILNALHDRIAEIRIFDPACGCGNFLVVAYRELRLLEYEILRRLYGEKVEPEHLKVRIEQVNGIEINEWPARIAEVAMFLIEHQMDDRMRELLPKFFTRLPIKSVANIHVGNALRMDWNDVLPANRCAYIVGNPPFVGKKERNSEQREDMKTVWGTSSKSGNLDYVTCWFKQASVYSKGTSVQTAFVATNSIAQGEQASSFLGALIDEGWNIKFAHRTFAWQSEARGAAHVKVIIVGFTWQRLTGALLFDYSQDATSGTRSAVSRLNQYLTEGGDAPSITARGRPLCAVPHMTYGSQAIDQERNAPEGTGLIVTSGQRLDLLRETPELEPFIKQYVGGKELLSGESRYCCWLEGAPPSLIRRSALLQIRLESVRKFRLASARAQTRRLATTPTLFGGNLQPTTDYLLIPKVTSETRDYIPMRFFGSDVIASGSALVVADANHFHFGVLTSAMHMGWMRRVAGRMKSDYQYSANVVYNNFPWPQEVDPKAKSAVEAAAQTVLDARAAHPNATLADLYDPLTMPPNLRAAHNDLDKAVDRCYRKQPFTSERERVEHLFELYQRLAAPLKAEAEPAKKKRTGRARSATSDTEAAK
jgi:hypothetical protein